MPIVSLLVAGGTLAGGLWMARRRVAAPAPVPHPAPDETAPDVLSPEIVEPSVEDEFPTIDRDLALSAGTLALATAGVVGSPLLLAASVPIQVFLSLPFVERGASELVDERRVGAGVLDATLSVAMLGTGLYFANALFFSFFYGSQKLLSLTRSRAEAQLTDLLGDRPPEVRVVRDGRLVSLPFDQVVAGDRVQVRAGEMMPVDGVVRSGEALLDQRALTGESKPVRRAAGDRVLASTIVLGGEVEVETVDAGADTVAARIGLLLRRTAHYKSTVQTRGEALVDRSAVPSLAVGGVTLAALGPVPALASMMGGFGYNMRVLAPLSVLKVLKVAADQGVLVKDGRILELLSEVDTVVFDKTGTLTEDRLRVEEVHVFGATDVHTALSMAAAAEQHQSHPLAEAIIGAARARDIELRPVADVHYRLGHGLRAQVDGRTVHVGSRRFVEAEGVAAPIELDAIVDACHARGLTLVCVAVDGAVCAAIEIHPTVRPEARAVVQALQARGLDLHIISGDHAAPTRHLAGLLGIDAYTAEVLPEDKAGLVEGMQAAGRSVCFVGDGINDALALKTAHASVSLAGATTIATDTAQVVLLDGGIDRLPALFTLADDLDQRLKRNFALTVVPGVITLGGIYALRWGVMAAMLVYNAGLAAGVGTSLAPASTERLPTHEGPPDP